MAEEGASSSPTEDAVPTEDEDAVPTEDEADSSPAPGQDVTATPMTMRSNRLMELAKAPDTPEMQQKKFTPAKFVPKKLHKPPSKDKDTVDNSSDSTPDATPATTTTTAAVDKAPAADGTTAAPATTPTKAAATTPTKAGCCVIL
eukprot:gb/GEZN01019691.1/.p1 GENE.gb/GEZN01019691.1/~~gb/GEZN01019691.1/.p1  ORF type:complete len:145 (-),score=27.08 gb/GEZN01019691.1/:175-609(-)